MNPENQTLEPKENIINETEITQGETFSESQQVISETELPPEVQELSLEEQRQWKIEEEQLMHLARFDKKSLDHAQRSFLKRIFDHEKDLSAVDFAHIEALRDLAATEKTRDPEFLEFEKNRKKAEKAMIEKRDNPNSPESLKTDIVLFGASGAMRGASCAGDYIGLRMVGMGEGVIKANVCASAGAACGCAFGGGLENIKHVAKLCYVNLCAGKFINFLRWHKIMDAQVAADLLDDETSPDCLDKKALMESSIDFITTVVNEEGESELIDAKTAKNEKGESGLIDAIKASMAAPVVYRKFVEVNGKRFIDGGVNAWPIDKIIEKYKKEKRNLIIYVLANIPFTKAAAFESSKGESFIAELAGNLDSIPPFFHVDGAIIRGKEFEDLPFGSTSTLGVTKKVMEMNSGIGQVLKMKLPEGVTMGVRFAPESDTREAGMLEQDSSILQT